MPEVIERVSVLEVQVRTLDEKIDDIKVEIKSINEGVLQTGKELKGQLDTMYDASCAQHAELGKKINELEKFKSKWMYLTIGGVAVVGWMIGHSQAAIKLLGLFSK